MFNSDFRVKRSIDIIDSWDQIINNDFSWPVLHRLVNRSNKVMKKKRSIQNEHISDILDDLELELYEAEVTDIIVVFYCLTDKSYQIFF